MRSREIDHGSAMFDAIIGSYLGHLGYGYHDIVWLLEAPPFSLHWLNATTAQEHNITFEWFIEEKKTGAK